MSLTSLVLKAAAPLPDLERFDRFLFIGPHPDDIEIGAGATAGKLAAAGKRVSFLICLDGRFGLEHAPQGTTPEALAELRKREAIESAKLLGVTDVHFLGLSDGGFYTREELLRGMAHVIAQVQPELLFAPDPCVASECHIDHLNVGNTARQLAFLAPFEPIMSRLGAEAAPVKAIAYYMTAKPNRYVGVSPYRKAQGAAIRCHVSQFPDGSDALRSVEVYLSLRSLDFGLRSLKGRAEGFRVLGTTHMHCLPEAGL